MTAPHLAYHLRMNRTYLAAAVGVAAAALAWGLWFAGLPQVLWGTAAVGAITAWLVALLRRRYPVVELTPDAIHVWPIVWARPTSVPYKSIQRIAHGDGRIRIWAWRVRGHLEVAIPLHQIDPGHHDTILAVLLERSAIVD